MLKLIDLLNESVEKDNLNSTIQYLKNKKNILFLTTSNRYFKENEIPKSSQLAEYIKFQLKSNVKIIDLTKLNIHICEGCVSELNGNECGIKESLLKDKTKNPNNVLRCWASVHNEDDELWKLTTEILKGDVIIFFTSVRWGSITSVYQKVMERLTWLENRQSTLGETNILKGKESGIIAIGQNWNAKNVVSLQTEAQKFLGFNTPKELSWSWQYTNDKNEESMKTYTDSPKKFENDFKIKLKYPKD